MVYEFMYFAERVYSELPEQPATIVDAFDLEKVIK